jgi:hypothetical protein
LIRYGVSWEFNGPLFEPLWRLSQGLGLPGWVESTLNAFKAATDHHPAWNRLYPYNYPQLHAKLLLAAGMGAAVLLSLWRLRRPVDRRSRRLLDGSGPTGAATATVATVATGSLLGVLLLCSATVYPWYLLWVLPFAALVRQPAWLALSALLPLSYLPQLVDVPLWPWVYGSIWFPFLVLLVRFPRWAPVEAPVEEEPS